MTKSNPGRRGFVWLLGCRPSLRESQGRNKMQAGAETKAMGSDAHWLAQFAFLKYNPGPHAPPHRGVTVHRGLGPLTPFINQENASQASP